MDVPSRSVRNVTGPVQCEGCVVCNLQVCVAAQCTVCRVSYSHSAKCKLGSVHKVGHPVRCTLCNGPFTASSVPIFSPGLGLPFSSCVEESYHCLVFRNTSKHHPPQEG